MNPPRTLAQEADHQCIGLCPAAEHARAQRWNKQWPITEPCQR
jgi:hypothetical protein